MYRRRARFCIVFISEHYARKLWTNHERESVQARAFSASEEYLLPVRFDETEIPGIRPTTAYIDLRTTSPGQLAGLIAEKLGLIDRTAVFIDGDWLLGTAQSARVKVDFGALITGLRNSFDRDAPVCIHMSEFGRSVLKERGLSSLVSQGYSVEAAASTGMRAKGRSGVDVGLALRAAAMPANFRTLALLTGDSDFLPLIEQAKAAGRQTVLIACETHVAEGPSRRSGPHDQPARRAPDLADPLNPDAQPPAH